MSIVQTKLQTILPNTHKPGSKTSTNSNLNQSRLLTVSEAAQELRISNWLVYELIRSKQLRTLTIATRRLVDSSDLENFINERKEKEYAS